MAMRTIMALLGIISFGGLALAGNISITTTQGSSIDGEQLRVDLTIGNSGDEAAHAVSPVLRFGEASVRGARHETLAPGARVTDTLEVAVGALGPGRWSYAIAVDYADANQYPFQALQMGSVTVGNPPPAKVAVPKMTAEPLAKEGSLAITVKNLSGESRTVGMTLHVPDGLEIIGGAREVALEPWQEQALDVAIVNRTALPGSRYPIFAAVEYDLDETHYSVVAQGIVEITSAQNFVERHGGQFRFWAIGLGLAFVLLVGWRLIRS
jgi:hypothetical protein